MNPNDDYDEIRRDIERDIQRTKDRVLAMHNQGVSKAAGVLDPVAEWDQIIAARVADGLPTSNAIREVVKNQPELHAAFVASKQQRSKAVAAECPEPISKFNDHVDAKVRQGLSRRQAVRAGTSKVPQWISKVPQWYPKRL